MATTTNRSRRLSYHPPRGTIAANGSTCISTRPADRLRSISHGVPSSASVTPTSRPHTSISKYNKENAIGTRENDKAKTMMKTRVAIRDKTHRFQVLPLREAKAKLPAQYVHREKENNTLLGLKKNLKPTTSSIGSSNRATSRVPTLQYDAQTTCSATREKTNSKSTMLLKPKPTISKPNSSTTKAIKLETSISSAPVPPGTASIVTGRHIILSSKPTSVFQSHLRTESQQNCVRNSLPIRSIGTNPTAQKTTTSKIHRLRSSISSTSLSISARLSGNKSSTRSPSGDGNKNISLPIRSHTLSGESPGMWRNTPRSSFEVTRKMTNSKPHHRSPSLGILSELSFGRRSSSTAERSSASVFAEPQAAVTNAPVIGTASNLAVPNGSRGQISASLKQGNRLMKLHGSGKKHLVSRSLSIPSPQLSHDSGRINESSVVMDSPLSGKGGEKPAIRYPGARSVSYVSPYHHSRAQSTSALYTNQGTNVHLKSNTGTNGTPGSERRHAIYSETIQVLPGLRRGGAIVRKTSGDSRLGRSSFGDAYLSGQSGDDTQHSLEQESISGDLKSSSSTAGAGRGALVTGSANTSSSVNTSRRQSQAQSRFLSCRFSTGVPDLTNTTSSTTGRSRDSVTGFGSELHTPSGIFNKGWIPLTSTPHNNLLKDDNRTKDDAKPGTIRILNPVIDSLSSMDTSDVDIGFDMASPDQFLFESPSPYASPCVSDLDFSQSGSGSVLTSQSMVVSASVSESDMGLVSIAGSASVSDSSLVGLVSHSAVAEAMSASILGQFVSESRANSMCASESLGLVSTSASAASSIPALELEAYTLNSQLLTQDKRQENNVVQASKTSKDADSSMEATAGDLSKTRLVLDDDECSIRPSGSLPLPVDIVGLNLCKGMDIANTCGATPVLISGSTPNSSEMKLRPTSGSTGIIAMATPSGSPMLTRSRTTVRIPTRARSFNENMTTPLQAGATATTGMKYETPTRNEMSASSSLPSIYSQESYRFSRSGVKSVGAAVGSVPVTPISKEKKGYGWLFGFGGLSGLGLGFGSGAPVVVANRNNMKNSLRVDLGITSSNSSSSLTALDEVEEKEDDITAGRIDPNIVPSPTPTITLQTPVEPDPKRYGVINLPIPALASPIVTVGLRIGCKPSLRKRMLLKHSEDEPMDYHPVMVEMLRDLDVAIAEWMHLPV